MTSPSLIDDFKDARRALADRVCVRSGATVRTFGEITETARRLVAAFDRNGVSRDSVVEVEGVPGPGLLSALLAMLSCSVPFQLVTPPRTRAVDPFDDTAVFLRVNGDRVPLTALADANPSTRDLPSPAITGDTPAYLIETSGSTGDRKRVIGSYTGLSRFLRWERDTFHIGGDDRVAALTSPTFDVSLRELLLPFATGAELVVPHRWPLSPGRITPFIAETAATVVNVVPSLAAYATSTHPTVTAPSLRLTLFAGEMLPHTTVRAWQRFAPHSATVNLYGPTETTLAQFANVIDEPVPGIQPVGFPLPGTSFRIVDGEVVIATPNGSLGYADEPATDRLIRDGGMTTFATGDLGRVEPDGALMLLGRRDDRVKVRGIWVNLTDVEQTLRDALNREEIAVVTSPNPLGVDIVAVIAGSERHIDKALLVKTIAHRCGSAAIPSAYRFVPRLPRLASGKIDRRRCRSLAVDPAAQPGL
ncbi:AMP-binding protein [Stackebrandtia nassauensis]|uniref:AMP-dependent synthetase and ligase n=1 Tax=Stackebrandtia nassauensis (strain DSM 44728 / CIP 108903 / NRRL B-16338 / NBRC 102104 / LLR-40K-21) TaxID=446470 RepID=D3PVQ3_STANL|nr:AMP-binding protein [Stackebrandtia nassauensis]ADD43167.1 AMP-dependent synthetase and ligase [Stackebrandtia nassauensis DSM 44728]